MDRGDGDNGHPLADLYPDAESHPVVGDDYRPIRPVGRWAIGLLVIALVLDVVALVSGLSERSLLGQDVITISEADANDRRQGLIAVAQLVALISTAVFFIRWTHRAYKNLPELGIPDVRYKTGWAIGSWFVPILISGGRSRLSTTPGARPTRIFLSRRPVRGECATSPAG